MDAVMTAAWLLQPRRKVIVNAHKAVFDYQSERHCSKTGIHNHPSNIPPTGSDFATSRDRQYAGAIVALHNGDVYYYKHGHSLFNAREFDSSVKNRINKGLDETDAFIATMQEFAERFGIQWKKM